MILLHTTICILIRRRDQSKWLSSWKLRNYHGLILSFLYFSKITSKLSPKKDSISIHYIDFSSQNVHLLVKVILLIFYWKVSDTQCCLLLDQITVGPVEYMKTVWSFSLLLKPWECYVCPLTNSEFLLKVYKHPYQLFRFSLIDLGLPFKISFMKFFEE